MIEMKSDGTIEHPGLQTKMTLLVEFGRWKANEHVTSQKHRMCSPHILFGEIRKTTKVR